MLAVVFKSMLFFFDADRLLGHELIIIIIIIVIIIIRLLKFKCVC